MEDLTIRKNGLVYTSDSKCVVGIDSQSDAFHGAVPNGAEAVGEEAFSCCNLTQISLPDSVVSVGTNAFGNSERLESVRLPAGLRTLAPYMFSGCASLKRVEMPVEVDGFPEGLFSGCASLPEIPFRAGIRSLPSGVAEGCGSLTSLVIPDSVTEICAGAVSGCGKLKTIVFPAGLETLADGAVSDCPALERLRISEENAFFYTDEDGRVLYRRNADGSGTAVLEAAGAIRNAVPTVRETDDSANPSIINYEETEDDSEEVDVIFNSEGSQAAAGFAPAEGAAEISVEERLAEIMKQDKQYISGDFSIMDIPEASEEELAADCLAPSATAQDAGADAEEEEDSSEAAEIDAEPESAEAGSAEDGFVEENKSVYGISDEEPAPSDGSEKGMEERLAEIMAQDKEASGGNFSIMDIPAASEEEISADRIVLSEGDMSAGVELDDAGEPYSGAVSEASSDDDSEADNEDDGVVKLSDDNTIMHNLFFEADKVEQQNLSHEGMKDQRLLYVFTEKLADGNHGKIFSRRLVNCCRRIADIHGFTTIYFFHGIKLDNEKFRRQLKRFTASRDVIYACTATATSGLSAEVKDFIGVLGISLAKEDILSEEASAGNRSERIKLLLQDNLAD